MAVIIPDALQKKTDADPEYAKEIMAKDLPIMSSVIP